MITTVRRQCIIIIMLLSFFVHTQAQDFRSFNQNSSRSNHASGLNISFSPLFSNAINNSNDSLLFRGSGAGFRFGADYFFGKASIGFSSGFGSSSPDDAAINNFLKRSSIPPDQLLITKAKQQNMYLLLGPSVKFGNTVELNAHAKGGLFINNSGLVSIQQKGAVRAAYRNESTAKSIYPGFLTGLNVQYNTKSDVWSFGIGADYMNTKSEVNNYDYRRGGGIEALKLSRNISDIVAGITIRYNILSPRDAQSGQSTGRLLPTVNKREIISARESSSGMATGRLLPTVNKREIISPRDAQSGQSTGRLLPTVNKKEINLNESCGPVTTRTTNSDGSIEEMTFACPDDAAAYSEKINPQKQKQWLPSNFRTTSDEGKDRGIVSGRLTWPSSNTATGIITNKNISVRGGSTAMNSQTTRTTPSNSFGTMVRLSAREAGSGMATGKKAREAGSGMATGKRQYEPVFAEGEDDVCNPCLVTAKSNPMYKGNMSAAQNNPLYEGNGKTLSNTDEDCDGIAGIDVLLIDLNSNGVIAKTKTESCGDFFFANVPEGDYIVKVKGVIAGKKGYDIYIKSKTDLAGSIEQGIEPVQLMINSGANDSMMQKAGISTSRSNIRTKSISIIEADLDGDGEFESLKAIGTFSDESTRDITADAQTTGKKSIVINGSALQMHRRGEVLKSNKQGNPDAGRTLSSIIVATGDLDGDGKAAVINNSHSNIKNLKAVAFFSDGSTQDVTGALAINTSHSNLKQYSIVVADLDGDGTTDAIIKTKTKSNQSNDRVAVGDVNGDGVDIAINNSHSNIKNLRVASGDVDGDGKAELLVGGFIPGGSVISAAMMPGDPIPGLDVKLGRNPGGQALQNTTSNENGEFEFRNLEAGDYFITMEQNIVIDDETIVTIRGNAAENINTSESNLKNAVAAKGDIKVSASQNSQTLKQNGPIKWMAPESLTSILIEADLDGDGEYESNVSNKLSDELIADKDGKISENQKKAGVSTSRSNIRLRGNLIDKGDGLYVSFGTAILNDKEVHVKIVYKVSHDIPMNAIRNLKG